MERSNTTRFAALLGSICITFSLVAVIAGYAYPEQGAQLASTATTPAAT